MSLKISLAIVATVCSFMTYGQAQKQAPTQAQPKNQNPPECKDNFMHSQLVSIDNALENQGFKLVQYQLVNMPSGAYVPLFVTLEKDKMYQMNFVANKGYSQYTFVLMDKDHKKWIDLKVKQKENKDHLTQSFAAPESGQYVVILTQKVKGQDATCGGFSMLKAVNDHLPAGK
jgi:hypothetical protein